MGTLEASPELLHAPELAFFRKYVTSLGGTIPEKKKHEHSHADAKHGHEHGHAEAKHDHGHTHSGDCCGHDRARAREPPP